MTGEFRVVLKIKLSQPKLLASKKLKSTKENFYLNNYHYGTVIPNRNFTFKLSNSIVLLDLKFYHLSQMTTYFNLP